MEEEKRKVEGSREIVSAHEQRNRIHSSPIAGQPDHHPHHSS